MSADDTTVDATHEVIRSPSPSYIVQKSGHDTWHLAVGHPMVVHHPVYFDLLSACDRIRWTLITRAYPTGTWTDNDLYPNKSVEELKAELARFEVKAEEMRPIAEQWLKDQDLV